MASEASVPTPRFALAATLAIARAFGPTCRPPTISRGPSGTSAQRSKPRSGPPAELRLLPLLDRDEVALGDAGVELARAADALLGVLDHLLPLCDPPHRAREREERREHRGREAHRLQDDARIEIDVRVELAIDE